MKHRLILNLLLVTVVLILSGCQDDKTLTITTNDVAEFIVENKLDYDDEGNSYQFSVEYNGQKNKVIIKVQVVTKKMKAAIKEEFGDSVKIVESDEVFIIDG